MLNRFALIFLSLIFFMSSSYKTLLAETSGVQENESTISDRTINSISDNLPITARLPEISSPVPSAFTIDFNEKINEIYLAKEKAARSLSAKKLFISYEKKIDGLVTSIIINTNTTISTASVRRDVDTINVNFSSGKILGINDVLGVNGVSIANKVIYDAIAADPQKYNQPFFGIKNEHDFYVDNNKVYIVFDSFEIASGKEGTPKFEIDKSKIKNITLSSNSYAEKEAYNLKMIPLRNICEYFGYSVTWHSYPPSADVKRTNSKKTEKSVSSPVFIGENRYYKNSGTRHLLESAPELISLPNSNNAVACVPISYFSEMLSLFYYVDSYGTITFSEYSE